SPNGVPDVLRLQFWCGDAPIERSVTRLSCHAFTRLQRPRWTLLIWVRTLHPQPSASHFRLDLGLSRSDSPGARPARFAYCIVRGSAIRVSHDLRRAGGARPLACCATESSRTKKARQHRL